MLSHVWALVPVKDFCASKQRLGAALSASSRSRLAEAMMRDVLGTLTSVPQLERVAIITKDKQAKVIATEMDVFVIEENENQGETEAVTQAIRVLLGHGARTMLVVPGDVPYISRKDVEAILEASRGADIVLVPAHDGRGTNAVLLTPPNAFALRFGYDSFRPHLASALALNLRVTVLHLATIGLDIDTPSDLASLSAWPPRSSSTRTDAVLDEIQHKLQYPELE